MPLTAWTRHWDKNAAQVEEKHRFAMLLSELCRGIPEPVQATGRPGLPLSDMVFATLYKAYVGFSSRRFTTDLRDAHTDGLVTAVCNVIGTFVLSMDAPYQEDSCASASVRPWRCGSTVLQTAVERVDDASSIKRLRLVSLGLIISAYRRKREDRLRVHRPNVM